MSDFKQELARMLASGELKVSYAFVNFLWAIGLMILSAVLQVLMTPKQDKPKAATLDDFEYPTFEENTPQPIYFGDNWSPDFFVGWYGNLRTSAIRSSGGKK